MKLSKTDLKILLMETLNEIDGPDLMDPGDGAAGIAKIKSASRKIKKTPRRDVSQSKADPSIKQSIKELQGACSYLNGRVKDIIGENGLLIDIIKMVNQLEARVEKLEKGS